MGWAGRHAVQGEVHRQLLAALRDETRTQRVLPQYVQRTGAEEERGRVAKAARGGEREGGRQQRSPPWEIRGPAGRRGRASVSQGSPPGPRATAWPSWSLVLPSGRTLPGWALSKDPPMSY